MAPDHVRSVTMNGLHEQLFDRSSPVEDYLAFRPAPFVAIYIGVLLGAKTHLNPQWAKWMANLRLPNISMVP